jgi:hypothetical protein
MSFSEIHTSRPAPFDRLVQLACFYDVIGWKWGSPRNETIGGSPITLEMPSDHGEAI